MRCCTPANTVTHRGRKRCRAAGGVLGNAFKRCVRVFKVNWARFSVVGPGHAAAQSGQQAMSGNAGHALAACVHVRHQDSLLGSHHWQSSQCASELGFGCMHGNFRASAVPSTLQADGEPAGSWSSLPLDAGGHYSTCIFCLALGSQFYMHHKAAERLRGAAS